MHETRLPFNLSTNSPPYETQRNENLDHIPECYFSDIHSNAVLKFSN